jgi:hypothetical protein
MRIVLLLLCLVFSVSARSEVYQGITASSSLGDIKKRFPNATIKKVDAAWVTSSDGFYIMTGVGLPGTTYLAFFDPRPLFSELLAKEESKAIAVRRLPDSDEKASKLKNVDESLALDSRYANESDDDALTINWIRWVPDAPIPVARYIAKFGTPSKTIFKDDTMQPYSSWTSRGLGATLSDDQKLVLSVEYTFTDIERKNGCRAKYGPMSAC